MENNVLPSDIDNIIANSMKTIDVYTLWVWLKIRRIKFRYKNRSPFRFLTEAELKELIESAIKEYYYNTSPHATSGTFLFTESISEDVRKTHVEPYIEHGGIYIAWKGSFFEVDFFMLMLCYNNPHAEDVYFKKEILHYAKNN